MVTGILLLSQGAWYKIREKHLGKVLFRKNIP